MSGGSGYPSQLIFAIPLATESTEGPQVRRGVTMPSVLMRRIPTACDDRQQARFLSMRAGRKSTGDRLGIDIALVRKRQPDPFELTTDIADFVLARTTTRLRSRSTPTSPACSSGLAAGHY